jgi:hypothetical protein
MDWPFNKRRTDCSSHIETLLQNLDRSPVAGRSAPVIPKYKWLQPRIKGNITTADNPMLGLSELLSLEFFCVLFCGDGCDSRGGDGLGQDFGS